MSQCCSEIDGAFFVNNFADVRPHHKVVTVANTAVTMPLQGHTSESTAKTNQTHCIAWYMLQTLHT